MAHDPIDYLVNSGLPRPVAEEIVADWSTDVPIDAFEETVIGGGLPPGVRGIMGPGRVVIRNEYLDFVTLVSGAGSGALVGIMLGEPSTAGVASAALGGTLAIAWKAWTHHARLDPDPYCVLHVLKTTRLQLTPPEVRHQLVAPKDAWTDERALRGLKALLNVELNNHTREDFVKELDGGRWTALDV